MDSNGRGAYAKSLPAPNTPSSILRSILTAATEPSSTGSNDLEWRNRALDNIAKGRRTPMTELGGATLEREFRSYFDFLNNEFIISKFF